MNNLFRNNTANQQKDRVLHVVTQFYPPDYAPTGQLIKELVTALGEQGNRIRIYTGQPGYAFNQNAAPLIEHFDQIVVQRMPAASFWSKRIRGKLINGLFFLFEVGKALLDNVKKDDILLLTTAPPFLLILGYLIKLLKGTNYVCLIYDLYPDVAVQLEVASANSWIVRLWHFLNRQIWKNAEQIIVLSSSMKERVLAKHPKLGSKITVIHNWADHNWIVPMAKSTNWFAHEYNLVDKFTVLYSGNLGRCHDMETLLEAAYLLQKEPIQFVFIGDGAGYQACLEKVESWGLQNCLFLPYQNRQTIPYSLTACDLSLVSIKSGMEGVVAPSKFYSILASGRPVAAICDKRSYLRQLIKSANCGDTFDNGNWLGLSQFIRRLANDAELAKKMGQAGRSYLLSNFTLDIIAAQYAKALNMQGTVSKPKEKLLDLRSFSAKLLHPYTGKPIGQLLQEAGLISSAQIEELLQEQATQYPHLRFGEIAVMKGWIQQETVNLMLEGTAHKQQSHQS